MYKQLLNVTGGKERMRHFIAEFDPPGGERAAGQIAELHADKTVRYTRMVEVGAAVLRPGVERLIREARTAGLKVAIATTTSQPNVEALVRATLGPDCMALFDVVAAGDIVSQKKPHPDVYLRVLDALGIGPADAVAFEDSENGLRSAAAAGLPTIITPSVYTDDQRFDGALAVLSDLGDPGRPYRHIAGVGDGEAMVTATTVGRWLAEARQ